MSKELSFGQNAAISACAASVSKTAAAPIERIKLLLQNQGEILKQGKIDKPYVGIIDCARRTYTNEGIASFWRGNLTNVIRYFPTQGLNFAFKDKIKALFVGSIWKNRKFTRNILTGGLAGTITNCIVYSLDYARTRLANDVKVGNSKRQYKGLIDVYYQTIKTDGIKGLYRGFAVSFVCIFIYRGLYFGLYDSIKPYFTSPRFFELFLLGWFSTICAGLACYPLDTVRRRMMMTSGHSTKYSSGYQAFKLIYQNEGGLAFFKGGSANIFRSLAGAGVLAGVDFIKSVMFV